MDIEELFKKGFNFGYILSKFNPELSKKITIKPNPASNFHNGLVWGKKEFEKELVKTRENDLKKIRKNTRHKGKDLNF